VRLHQGDIPTARLLLEKSEALLRQTSDEEHEIAWLRSLFGKLHAAQGDSPAARTSYEESLQSLVHLQSRPNHNLLFLDLATVLEGLAAVVAAQGELAWAVRLWGAAQALRETRRMPLPPIYRAGYERAIAALRTQLGEKTFAALWSEGCSMTPGQALAARGPATISSPAVTSLKLPVTYPDRLTAREVEVLRLVAQGLSDAQIADKLVISPRTVNTHLSSIYNKIQVSSRSGATRYAIEHQLQ
jgi:DNA-binding CsgD family transcriptional regulator